MLVLSRRPDEKILLPSVPAVIRVISSSAGVVRLGIEAPPHVPIVRGELARKEPTAGPARAGGGPTAGLSHLLRNRLHNLGLGLALLRIHLAEGSDEAREVIGGMEQEMEALRLALQADSGSGTGESSLAVQPVA
jgi:carbon storage regulator CsrA